MITNFDQIVSNASILGGKPTLKGTRISVELILDWIANGSSVSQIIEEFPHLSSEAVKQAILYAAETTKNTSFYEIEIAA
jgi:uncharacterized protein (DUF433 family)